MAGLYGGPAAGGAVNRAGRAAAAFAVMAVWLWPGGVGLRGVPGRAATCPGPADMVDLARLLWPAASYSSYRRAGLLHGRVSSGSVFLLAVSVPTAGLPGATGAPSPTGLLRRSRQPRAGPRPGTPTDHAATGIHRRAALPPQGWPAAILPGITGVTAGLWGQSCRTVVITTGRLSSLAATTPDDDWPDHGRRRTRPVELATLAVPCCRRCGPRHRSVVGWPF